MTKKIFIKPNDTLFFRDGKPFSMGEQTEATPIFPPFPSTVYGAMRGAYIAQKGGLCKFLNGGMKAEIGTTTEKGAFEIKCCLIGNESYNLYSVPRDLAKPDKLDKCSYYFQLKQMTNLPFVCSHKNNIDFLWNTKENKVKYSDGDRLTHGDLIAYLEGREEEFKPIEQSCYLKYEPKVGIGRSKNTHTTEEGKLYRVSMLRLINDYGITVDYSGIDLGSSGMMKLGGEGKTASYYEIKGNLSTNVDTIVSSIDTAKKFKLYFATPAIFANGWLPAGMNKDDLIWDYKTLKLKLITASIGKPSFIGGWDLASKGPKPMRRAVSAGSVYYFELLDGNSRDVIEKFDQKNISDYLQEEGFGFSLVGVI